MIQLGLRCNWVPYALSASAEAAAADFAGTSQRPSQRPYPCDVGDRPAHRRLSRPSALGAFAPCPVLPLPAQRSRAMLPCSRPRSPLGAAAAAAQTAVAPSSVEGAMQRFRCSPL